MIITVLGTAASVSRACTIRAKMPLSAHRFQRLSRVLGGPWSLGASRHHKPLQLKISCGTAHADDRNVACHGSWGGKILLSRECNERCIFRIDTPRPVALWAEYLERTSAETMPRLLPKICSITAWRCSNGTVERPREMGLVCKSGNKANLGQCWALSFAEMGCRNLHSCLAYQPRERG